MVTKCKWCDCEIRESGQLCGARDLDLCEPADIRCKRCGKRVKPPGIHTCLVPVAMKEPEPLTIQCSDCETVYQAGEVHDCPAECRICRNVVPAGELHECGILGMQLPDLPVPEPDNVVKLASYPLHKQITRTLHVEGRDDIRDQMVRTFLDEGLVALRSAGTHVDFWEMTPEQAEYLGMALIQVAAQVRLHVAGVSDDEGA